MAPIEGSNRDLISANASQDYIEKLSYKNCKNSRLWWIFKLY